MNNETPETGPNEDGFQLVSPERFLEMKLQEAAVRKFQEETEHALADPERAAALRDAVCEEEPPNDWTNPNDAFGSRPPVEEPDFEELLALLTMKMDPSERDVKRHDEQMEKVSQRQRAAMVEADAEQKLDSDRTSEAEPLAWGLWKSQCGCIHISVPDGKGGWAAKPEEVDPAKLAEVLRSMVYGLAEAGVRMLETLRSTEETP